jgi:hypothetical protein
MQKIYHAACRRLLPLQHSEGKKCGCGDRPRGSSGRVVTEILGARADVRFGSKADILLSQTDVRFTPKSGHAGRSCGIVFRLLRARDGDIRSHVGAHLSFPKKWSKV